MSKLSPWTRVACWLSRVAWLGLAMEIILWFFLSSISTENLLFLLSALIVIVLGTWACTVLLVVRYRRIFGTWYGLAGLWAALALVNWGRGKALPGDIEGLLLMGMLVLIAAFPTSIILLLCRRDASVKLIGLALPIFIWGFLLAAIPYGGPIQVVFHYLPSSGGGKFWWFETLACLLASALPWGSLAFLLYFGRLIVKEIRGD